MSRIVRENTSSFLNSIINFFNSNEQVDENLITFLNESSSDQLVPACAFIGYWLSNHYSQNTKELPEISERRIQFATYLLDLIFQKVPPIILLSGISSLDWIGLHSFHLNMAMLQSLTDRLFLMKTFMQPFSVDFHFSIWYEVYSSRPSNDIIPSLFYTFKDTQILINDYISHFSIMITNHLPFQAFERYYKIFRSDYLLVYAILSIIKKLNSSRDLTHPQLLFMFSDVFRYANFFANNNHLNVLLFITSLQDLPHISPFCMFGIMNSISQNSVLYKLLIPSEIARNPTISKEDAIKIICNIYHIIDLSFDNSLEPLVQEIPSLLARYFGCYNNSSTINSNPTTEIDQILYFQKLESTTIQKIYALVKLSSQTVLSELVISTLPFDLIKAGTIFILKSFKQLIFSFFRSKSAQITFASILAKGLPNINESVYENFHEICYSNPELSAIAFRMIYLYLLIPILKTDFRSSLFPFVIKNINNCKENNSKSNTNDSLIHSAHILLFSFIRSGICPLSNEIENAILESNDLLLVLEVLDSIDYMKSFNNFEEYEKAHDFKRKLIRKLQGTESESSERYYFDLSNQGQLNLNKLSKDCLQFCSLLSSSNDPNGLISKNGCKIPVYMYARVLASSKAILRRNLCEVILNKLIEEIHNNSSLFEDNSIPLSNFAFQTSKFFIVKLMENKQIDLAELLFIEMLNFLPEVNDLSIFWLFEFVQHFHNFMTEKMKYGILNVIRSNKNYCAFALNCNDDQLINKSIDLMYQNFDTVYQNQSILLSPVMSPFIGTIIIDSIEFFLRLSEERIVDSLSSLFTNFVMVISNRKDRCQIIAPILSIFPNNICCKIFVKLLEKPYSEIVMHSGSIMFMSFPLKSLEEICNSTTRIINHSDARLYTFMKMVLPSLSRFKGSENIGAALICGLLESVSETTPKQLQEGVIDAMGLAYVLLKLHKFRAEFIAASKNFLPELKTIIASSLEIDIEKSGSKSTPMFKRSY